MILARVLETLHAAQRESRIDESRIVLDKDRPFMIPGHGQRSITKTVDGIVGVLGFTSQNAGQGVVRLLDLADYNRLQFPSRAFEVKVCLDSISHGKFKVRVSVILTRCR